MRKLLALSAVVIFSATSTAQANAQVLRLPHKPWRTMNNTQKIHYLKKQIRHDRGIIRFAKNHRELQSLELLHAKKWAAISLRIAQASLHKLLVVPVHTVISGAHTAALMCIHRYEGSWTDPGGPYWGGLQMDLNFQAAYGPEFLRRWGTADHWPIWAQLQAAERAIAVRGFSPWPNTARYCGVY